LEIVSFLCNFIFYSTVVKRHTKTEYIYFPNAFFVILHSSWIWCSSTAAI